MCRPTTQCFCSLNSRLEEIAMEITDQTLCFCPLLPGWSKHICLFNFCLSSFSETEWVWALDTYIISKCIPKVFVHLSLSPLPDQVLITSGGLRRIHTVLILEIKEKYFRIESVFMVLVAVYDTANYQDLTLLSHRIYWFRKTTMQNIKTGQIFTGYFTTLGKAFKTQIDNMQNMHY